MSSDLYELGEKTKSTWVRLNEQGSESGEPTFDAANNGPITEWNSNQPHLHALR